MRHHYGDRALGAACSRFVAASLVLLCVLIGCKQKDEPVFPDEQIVPASVTLCHGSVTDILPRIALEQGYFAEEGLAVTLKEMSDGKLAFDGLQQGECNFAVTGAPPIILADSKKIPFAILATVLSDDDSTRIIARRDHGIVKPQDLRGKRIGVKSGLIGHLFLDLFMMKYGLEQGEVEQVFMDSDRLQAALASGEIDGFSMTNKMVHAAARTLVDKGVVFAEPGLNTIYGILTTRPDIPHNLEAAPRVLKALVRAEQYAKSEPAAAKGLVAKGSQLSAQEMEEVWSRATIEVALASPLFVHLEDQYRWQAERGETPALVTMPNYLDLVFPEYLRAVKPDAVSAVKH